MFYIVFSNNHSRLFSPQPSGPGKYVFDGCEQHGEYRPAEQVITQPHNSFSLLCLQTEGIAFMI